MADEGDESSDDGTLIELAVHEADGTTVVVAGEIDATTALELRGTLDALVRAGTSRIVLDLSATSLLDSTGIGVLVRANRHLRAAGGALALAGAPRIVRRVLEVTGVDRELPCHADVDAARAALP